MKDAVPMADLPILVFSGEYQSRCTVLGCEHRLSWALELSQVSNREASSEEEDTPPKVKGPRVHAPTPNPRGGKKAAALLPAPEPGETAGALPDTKDYTPPPPQAAII
ncbi:hypothetical protein P4O66_002805 [Electrophorus voltai]|uniref:Uncharacterized protein n=1 Tax=Electrophorus voltai TaxID=2609070 RepID=A0AAD8YU94_9TELE|nr:hypothetical protein P4O66_002805 [Electrophorus voltai]